MYRILHVEDDVRLWDMLKIVARSAKISCDVICVGSAEEAVFLLKREGESFDLAVVDFQLGPADGLSLIKAIKLNLPNLPCILMSGYVFTDADLKLGKEDRFVEKDGDVHALISAVVEMLPVKNQAAV